MTSPILASSSNNDPPMVLRGHSGWVISVAFSPTNRLLASGSYDNTIRLWDIERGAEVASLNGHSDRILSLTFSPEGSTLASGSRDDTIKLWDVESRTEIVTLDGHGSSVCSVTFSPDGAYLASGSGDKTIRFWNVKSRATIGKLEGHTDWVRSVKFSPDGKRIASGSDDSTIRLWDVASRTTIVTINGHIGWVMSVTFSHSGERLASAAQDKTIRFWNPTTGNHIKTMEGHSGVVTSIAFSPNDKHLASASNDGTIRLWAVESMSHISTLQGHTSSVAAVTFSADGTRLASGSDDQTIRVWKVLSEEATDLKAVTSTTGSVGSTQSPTNNQQDPITSPSTSVQPSNDFTESASQEYTSGADGQHGGTSPASGPISLNNDITGSVSLESTTLFGYGGFGELFVGVHTDRGKVALKKPRRLLDEALIRRFLREVDLWCSVSHQYILPCLGMCRVGPDVYVVSPFIENGDLLSCMIRGKALNRSKLLFEVAEALTHLHHRGIVHGDVKAQNILLADDGSALLCDFGLAKAFDTMATSTESKGAGSVRWMAPELFLGESRSMASDVYSLGITIAEVLSGHAPYQDMTETLAVMFHVVYHDGRPPKEPLSSPEGKSYATLWETAETCWAKDIKARPYMAQVLAMLFPLTRERA